MTEQNRTEQNNFSTNNKIKQPLNKWPKILPPLTEEQRRITDDFMAAHLEAMQAKWYGGLVESFNHSWPLKTFFSGCRTLEIGAGIGAQLQYEKFKEQEYHALELLPELCVRIKNRFPEVEVKCCDCQEALPYDDAFFDRIVAVHILEHLPNLSAAILEMRRVLKPNGRISIIIPCEGSPATTIARNISTRPHFEKKYKQPFDWFVGSQHINSPDEIFHEICAAGFEIQQKRYYPLFGLPFQFCNLVIGLTIAHKDKGE